jgi:fatty acid desaturase
LGLFYLAHLSLNYSLLLTLALDFAAALFLVRLFILQHDAGHGSFFPKKWMNDLLGFFTGVLTLVPYHHWQLSHARHHATSGNLDKRGVGDIYTKVREEVDLVKVAPTVTLKDAFKIAFADMHLHDEESRKLVGFKEAARRLRERKRLSGGSAARR